jgi:hypothetical protein
MCCVKKYNKVIFIDPGTNLGWAEWRPSKIVRRSVSVKSRQRGLQDGGAIALPHEPGERVRAFMEELERLMGAFCTVDPKIYLAWEEAAFGQFGRADRMYGTWEGLLLYFCEMHGVTYRAINQSTLKAYIREQGFYLGAKERKLLKPKDRKPKPRPEWKLYSLPKLQEHEIDARWGLEYVVKQLEVLK